MPTKAIKTVKISKELETAIEKAMKNANIEEFSEWARKSFEHYLSCKKKGRDPFPGLKPMLSRFTNKNGCSVCHRTIYVGEPILYGPPIKTEDGYKPATVVCVDCQIQRGMGDKSLVTKYLKMRMLERTSKALKAECDRLADQIENLTVADKLDEFFKKAQETHKQAMKYLKEVVGTEKEQEALDRIIKTTEEEMKVIQDTKLFLESKLKVSMKKKKERQRA